MDPQTPEIDTDDREHPQVSPGQAPSLGETAVAWMQLAGATAVANLVIYAVAVALGAEMIAELGFEQAVGPPAIIVASLGTLFISTFFWSLVAHRVPAFAHLWVPIGWGVGLLSLAAILGVSGLRTGIALGTMHLLTTAVATHLIPRRLPR